MLKEDDVTLKYMEQYCPNNLHPLEINKWIIK